MFRVEILDRRLPVWISTDLGDNLDERIDNNYFSASFHEALGRMDDVGHRRLCDLSQSIITGQTATGEEIPIVEGFNVTPNAIYPIFEKFVARDEAIRIKYGDILVVKDGSPGIVAPITRTFLDTYNEVAIGTHVYAIRLHDEYDQLSSFISCWLNSTYGQALLRRYIAGSVSPTLRREDLPEVIIPIPENETLAQECQQWLEELQRQVLEGTDFIRPSEEILRILGDTPSIPRLPTNWYSGVGRDPHGFHRRTQDLEAADENILKLDLPIWISDEIPEDRIDNNYSHPACPIAANWVESLNLPIKTIGQIKETIFVGETPGEEGEIPVIEGRNIKPNCLFADFHKYTDNEQTTLREYDLVIVRHGTSGVAAVILPEILDSFGELSVSDQIHVVRLEEEFKPYAPFMCAFLNSRIGQSLLRKYVGGSISPTLNRGDLVNVPIPLPQDNDILQRSQELLTNLQESFLHSSRLVTPSDRLLELMTLTQPLPKLQINWMPGGKRDPQGYYQR